MSPRDEWLLMANMLIPGVGSSDTDEDAQRFSQHTVDLARNIDLTRRAIAMGVALSALDGPLPVMDVIAFVGVSIYTTAMWSQFYFEYHY